MYMTSDQEILEELRKIREAVALKTAPPPEGHLSPVRIPQENPTNTLPKYFTFMTHRKVCDVVLLAVG